MTEEQKNKNFIQLYRNHVDDITNLALENSTAFKILMLLIKHMDGNNALCVSMVSLGEILHISRQAISKNIKYLKDNGWVCVLKNGTSNVYIVNPDIVWTSYSNQKNYCKFQANVLLSGTENAEYLHNPEAFTKFKTIDTEFIKNVQEKRLAYEEECKNFKEKYAQEN